VLLRRHVTLSKRNLELVVHQTASSAFLRVRANRTADFFYVAALLGSLETAFQQSRAGAFPVDYGLRRDDTRLTARTMEEFLDGAEQRLDEAESLINEFEA
jgi:hypothetical protein